MKTLCLILVVILTGCAADSTPRPAASSAARSTTADTAAAGDTASAVVALVNGRAVRMQALVPIMVETAGGQALGEWVLDQQINKALAEQKISLRQEDLDYEKRILMRQLDADPDQAARLMSQLRERRGLGPRRFEMLLRRNAALRKLVADDVQITPALVQQEYQRQYGQLTQVRMILAGSLKGASEALKRAQAGESFIDLAIELSEDASRAQGGLLPPISGEDPTWPQALREAAVKLTPGQISEPVALDAGWAILKCEKKIDQPQRPFADVRTELREQVRQQLERVRMQQLARALIEKADVTVLDADLDRSWKQQRGAFIQPGQ
ncbi:hypothetical protein HED60_04150 [Planctomycetales bacterium ZRK34]|nr:hypothetical protein HED60_04150 [Planctomycetales bacterium ZRK34]